MTHSERFAQNLKNLRLNSGKTQEETSLLFGLKRSTYSCYENAKAEPSLDTLVKVSAHYRVSLDTLLRRDIQFITKANMVCHTGERMLIGMRVY